MNAIIKGVAMCLVGSCAFAAFGGTALSSNSTGGTTTSSGSGVVSPVVELLPNLVIAGIDLDRSVTGSVFSPSKLTKTAYIRLKLQLANIGSAPCSPGTITIRTLQQYGLQTYSTQYPIDGTLLPNGSITKTVLVPIERITKGWETGFAFEVLADSGKTVREASEADNLGYGYGYYANSVLGEYLSQFGSAIGRGNEPQPKPKPIRDPGFFLPHLISPTRPGPIFY